MRKLPVGATVGHAIQSATRNFPFAVQVSLPWMLLLIPVVITTNLYLLFNNILPAPGEHPAPAKFGTYFLVILPMVAVQMVAFSSIAVNWHRYILRDEIPQGWERLRIDWLTWRYLGNVILIMLLVGLAMIAAVLGVALVTGLLWLVIGKVALAVGVPAYLFAIGWGMTLGQRLSIKMPAVALGREDFDVRQALEASRGNAWQVFGVLFLLLLCAIAIGMISLLASVVFNNLGSVGLSISFAVQVVVQWISTILGITILTSLCGFFVEGRNF